MPETSFPTVPEALLKELEKRFPERCPEMTWPDRKVWFEAGARSVVRFLRSQQEAQTKEKLPSVQR